jgi:hypothetical protein
MAGRGGRRSSTWPKGEKPKYVRQKGSKNKKTLVKEALGLTGWDALKEFIEGKGAEKLIVEMKKLNGKTYVNAMQAMSEYVKPKLRRVDGNLNTNISFKDEETVFE